LEAVADQEGEKRPFRGISYERFEESDERLLHEGDYQGSGTDG
jgi:hypothetical protein